MSDQEYIRLISHKFEFGVSRKNFTNFNDYYEDLFISRSSTELTTMLESLSEPQFPESASLQKRNLLRKAHGLRILSSYWLTNIINSKNQFQEHLVIFWHNFFGVRLYNPKFMAIHIDFLRNACFGNFKDLLIEITKDPAMIRFLNLQVSTAKHPNENYARELLELYSLGPNHFSEEDVKNIAAILTGIRSNEEGQYYQIEHQKNTTEYTVLQKNNIHDLEGVIDTILDNKQCARFVARRFAHFFIDYNISENEINHLAHAFYSENYNLVTLYKEGITLCLSDPERFQGSLYSSPLQFLIKTFTLFPPDEFHLSAISQLQRKLGQELLFPPSVAGWPNHLEWFDAQSYLNRKEILHNIQDGKQTFNKNLAVDIDDENPDDDRDHTALSFYKHSQSYIRDWEDSLDNKSLLDACFSYEPSHIRKMSSDTKNLYMFKNNLLKELTNSPEYHLR